MAYVYILIAIVCEVIATSALQSSQQFTRTGPTMLMLVGYGAAFFFLSLALRVLPVGIAYAIWSGVGIILISTIGVVWFRQTLDTPAIVGLALIVAGVIVVNVFSKSVTH